MMGGLRIKTMGPWDLQKNKKQNASQLSKSGLRCTQTDADDVRSTGFALKELATVCATCSMGLTCNPTFCS